ncbi:MAG: triose-phosphate isomerase, partial [Clostridia bacterium]|nr:triose-phosphate isomerase [Clostridia bacterium]
IWAIGTGKTATPEEANATIAVIRNTVADLFGDDTAEALRIQYGGSMNDANAFELIGMEHIDGGLIGGAALKADKFSVICKAGNNQ